MLQDLWKLSLAWDPQEISDKWTRFRAEIFCSNELIIQRHISCSNHVNIQLHGFADSSQKAYSAALYLHMQNTSNEIVIKLISSKTKVAPIETVTIPRLELCACLLFAKLFKKVENCLTIKVDEYNLWPDSTVALRWLRTSHLLQNIRRK